MTHFRYPDVSSWVEWAKEYRFGAFYIFPPAGVIEPVDALRQVYDPRSARSCQAHISLSEPLLGPLADDQIEELQAALSSFEPFEIRYGPVRSMPPYPGVVYAIEPESTFMQLRAVVHATSIFRGSAFSRRDIAPHTTIAEFISLERTHELLRELRGNVPEGTFLRDVIEYAVPTDQLYFE